MSFECFAGRKSNEAGGGGSTTQLASGALSWPFAARRTP